MQKLDKENITAMEDKSAARPCANVKNSKLLSSGDSFSVCRFSVREL